MTLPVVAEVVRGGFVEGHHAGSVVVLDPGGGVALSVGDTTGPVLPRSCAKPLQLVGSLRAGLPVDDDRLLAVAASSHNGEPQHVEEVRRLLAVSGLEESHLDNTPGLPLHQASATALLRAGGGPDRLHQNCSGKHAAMLGAAAANGWPIAGYRHPEHPVQRVITATVEELTGEPVAATVVDGCGAPLLAYSLTALARAFSRLVCAPTATHERRVADAMRAHPELVGGDGRDVTTLMRALPGALAKDGAEGTFAVALADGTAVAVKIDDGGGRARTPVLVAALRAAGVDVGPLAPIAETPVLGHGEPVGAVRAVDLAALNARQG